MISFMWISKKQAKVIDGDGNQNSGDLWGWVGNWLRTSMREPSEMLEMFYILIWVVVMWVYTYKQWGFMNFILCVLYLNKK